METWAIHNARKTLLCSDINVQELCLAHPGARLSVMPNLRADEGEICIADGVAAFAQALSPMLQNFNQSQFVGERGRLRAQELYEESLVMRLAGGRTEPSP